MRLKQQAGWNQTEADWLRFLDLEPEGCFVGEWDGVGAATLTTCIFGPVAWIAMVLVEESLRGRGIGKGLLQHALNFLDSRGVRSVRLDATALGKPLYEKLGFVPEYQLTRFHGTLPSGASGLSVTDFSRSQFAELVEFDRSVTGTNRATFFHRLIEDKPGEFRVILEGERIAGYLTARPGERAVQIGPCIATAETGPMLFADALARCGGQDVYFDIPIENPVPKSNRYSMGPDGPAPFCAHGSRSTGPGGSRKTLGQLGT
jgi:GNAT superfamily N-acetyltransferase